MGRQRFIVVNKDPFLIQKKVTSGPRGKSRFTTIEFSLYHSLYELNYEGVKALSDYIKKIEPFIDKSSRIYLNFINQRHMYIKILSEHADQFIEFLLEICNNKERYMTKVCESGEYSDRDKKMIKEWYKRTKLR
jgi:hypothetical protein